MNCKNCNAELEEGMNFCPACGAAQAEPETEAVEVTETVETVEAPVEEIVNSPRARAMREGFQKRCATEELCRRCGYARRF